MVDDPNELTRKALREAMRLADQTAPARRMLRDALGPQTGSLDLDALRRLSGQDQLERLRRAGGLDQGVLRQVTQLDDTLSSKAMRAALDGSLLANPYRGLTPALEQRIHDELRAAQDAINGPAHRFAEALALAEQRDLVATAERNARWA